MAKKILLVSRCAWTLYNFRAGLMRALKSAGHLVIGGGAAGDGYEPRIEHLGVPFVGLPVDKKGVNPKADLHLMWALYRWYGRERPEIVHHFTIKPVIYGSIAARLARVPKIVNTITGMGSVFAEEEKTRLRTLVEWMYRISVPLAHFTFFQNRDDLAFFVEHHFLDPARTGLLPGSGVDCEFFKPFPEMTRGKEAWPTFLMVSRLLRHKGVYDFVEAASMVKKRFPHVRFQLLGGRDERNPTVVPEADVSRWQAEGFVHWLGEVSDVRPALNRADVVVLPSYAEGIPRSLLEAAAMCKPIITTDTRGCRDTVEQGVNGLLVAARDPEALAGAMIAMIEAPELRERMGREGRRKVECEFDEKLVIERILKTYDGDRARCSP